MKTIDFAILTIIVLSSISSTNLKFVKNIYKGGKNHKNINRFGAPLIGSNGGRRPIYIGHRDKRTGIETIDLTKLNLKQKSDFVAHCILCGLTTNEQIMNAYHLAKQNNYIGDDDNIKTSNRFYQLVSEHFKTTCHNDWTIGGTNDGHFWVLNSEKKEIFNSKGLNTRR